MACGYAYKSRSYQIINKWSCINSRLIRFHKSKWLLFIMHSDYDTKSNWTNVEKASCGSRNVARITISGWWKESKRRTSFQSFESLLCFLQTIPIFEFETHKSRMGHLLRLQWYFAVNKYPIKKIMWQQLDMRWHKWEVLLNTEENVRFTFQTNIRFENKHLIVARSAENYLLLPITETNLLSTSTKTANDNKQRMQHKLFQQLLPPKNKNETKTFSSSNCCFLEYLLSI